LEKIYRLLIIKPEGMLPLRRPKGRWADNMKMGLRDTGWGSVDWTDLAEDRDQ
jgi:hypothetical protein